MVKVHFFLFLLETSWTAEWIAEYRQSRPGLMFLQQKIDDFMTALEAQLEQVFSSVFFRVLCVHHTWSSLFSIKLLLPTKKERKVFAPLYLCQWFLIWYSTIMSYNYAISTIIITFAPKEQFPNCTCTKYSVAQNFTKLCSHTHEYMCLNKVQFS